MKPVRVMVVAAAALAAGVLACVGDGAPSLSAGDYEPACYEQGVPGAARYDSAVSGIHPVIVFVWESPADAYVPIDRFQSYFPDDLLVSLDDPGAAELVACLTITGREFVMDCPKAGVGGAAELYNTSYQAELHNARTGAMLDVWEFVSLAYTDCTLYAGQQVGPLDALDADLFFFIEPWAVGP